MVDYQPDSHFDVRVDLFRSYLYNNVMIARRTLRSKKREIEAFLDLPPGLEEEFIRKETEDPDELYDPTMDFDDDEDGDADDGGKEKDKKKKKKKKKKGGGGGGKGKDKGEKPPRINTPTGFKVVKQVIRQKADGSQIVDLVVEVNKMGRADKYEFRITKADTGKSTVQRG